MAFLISAVFLFVLVSPSRSEMVGTFYRRFIQIEDKQTLTHWFKNHTYYMAYLKVQKEGFRITIELVGDSYPLKDALKELYKTDTHTMILNYQMARDIRTAVREYAHNTTAQVWSYAEIAMGPDGDRVSRAETEEVLGVDFTGMKVLAVGWTRNYFDTPESRIYNKSHIDDMQLRISRMEKWNYRFVFVFDAIALSFTPNMNKLFGPQIQNHAAMLRLYDYSRQELLNPKMLKEFVDNTNMTPLFFDLPKEIHAYLILNNDKFTTENPPKGGSRDCHSFAGLVCLFLEILLFLFK